MGAPDPLLAEGVHVAARRPFRHQLAEHVQTVHPEERLIEVVDPVGDIDVRRLVEAYDGAFGADRAEAHELHGVS